MRFTMKPTAHVFAFHGFALKQHGAAGEGMSTDNDGCCKSCEKLADEIERLREHHKLAVDNWTLEAQIVKQQEDEIHALKAEIERLQQMVKDAAQALNDEERENERLRGACASYEAQANRDAIEIKRLNGRVRELVAALDDQHGTPCEQIRHQQEIERLRNALAQSCDDQRQLAREELNFPCEAAMDNEVLRGLLRDGLRIDAGDFSVNVDEWIKRVREALGDKDDSKNT